MPVHRPHQQHHAIIVAIDRPTSAPNETCQFQWLDRNRPAGMPSTWLAANAVCTKPITRPRKCSANRSVTIASTIEPITPPNSPETMRPAISTMIVRRQRAQHGAEREADIKEQQQALAVEPIGKAGGEDAGNPGAEGIGRDRHAELRGGDVRATA